MPTGQDIVNSARKLLGAPYRVWSYGMPVPTWLNDGEGDPPTADYLLSTGVECADLVCFACADAGIPGVHYGTEGFYDYLINTVAFDPNTPAVPGAIALAPYEGASEGSQGHIAIFTGEHQLIQSLYTAGVTEAYDDATTAGWGGDTAFTLYGYLPGVDYSGTKPTPAPLGKGTPFSVDLLMRCYSNSLDRQTAEADLPYLLEGFKEFEINTKQRIACYLAVASGESGELEVFAEVDPRPEYGIFYGRGQLGLTFDFNYQHFSDYLGDPSIMSNPYQLEQPPMAIRSGCWFWRYGSVDGNLNDFADQGDFASCMAGVYGAPDPPNADTRIAYYNWILSQLPDDVSVGGNTPEEGDLSFAKYTFVASGEPNVDIANAAATALEALGVDCLVLTEADNIAAASSAINTTNDLTKLNCIVVGKETYALLDAGAQGRSGWSSDSPIWAMYADDGKPVGTLKRVRGWGLWWIYTYTEKIDKDKLLAVFDAVLEAISSDYTTLLKEAENQPDPPSPPPTPITLDELMAVKKTDLKDDDMVVILMRKDV